MTAASLTKESLASQLTGMEYPFEVPKDLADAAKEAGLLVVYGASDDLMEFDGAFREEVGAYEGTTAHLDRRGVLNRDQTDDDEAIADFVIRRRKSRTIDAVWNDYEISWQYRTEIPHATFDVMEDGEVYCRGIVIDTRDLPEPEATASEVRSPVTEGAIAG